MLREYFHHLNSEVKKILMANITNRHAAVY
jgi:hypothetical protein